ncbi:MAG: hypothetical protein E6L07_08290 [Verrucomicrobia bacterium]|nr:MAG: hypothetical protein E6L07_08290 [Verrucomicrobiota bacterium]
MAGALSIPFLFLSLFNVFSQRFPTRANLYWNPYVKPNMWDDHDKWSSKARRWAMGWLECEEEQKNKQGK